MVQVHVYERASKLRPSGGSIALFSPNLFAALDALGAGVTEAVKVICAPCALSAFLSTLHLYHACVRFYDRSEQPTRQLTG